MNSANLTDVQPMEAEDDYRICTRRGSTEEAKLDEDLGVAEGQEVEVQVKIVQPARKWGEGILRSAGAVGRSGASPPESRPRRGLVGPLAR
jgi:hypothetical protein